ncbi:MAG: S1 RNA-binding domain-containing protein [Cyanobacteria bacterium P01_H01_bin.74]
MSPRKVYMSHGDDDIQSPERLEFEKLLEKYDYSFKRGDIIQGTVITVDSHGALVDVGGKTAAYLPNKEAANPYTPAAQVVKPNEILEFFILVEEDEDGKLTLSLRRVQSARNWQTLEKLKEDESPVDCKVTSVVKGGLLVEVLGLRGFIPSSHLRLKQPLDNIVDEVIKAKIITLDKLRNNIILSHRKMVSEQMAEQRKDLFSQLQEGTKVKGEVVRLTDFGAFIDLGGVDGLLPLSQMSWRWVEHPSDILKIGDSLEVEVIGIDKDRQRVSLSIKGQNNDPWTEVGNKFSYGDSVEGTITRLKHFGGFVEIYPGVEALLPSRDIVEYEGRNSTKLEPGHKVTTFITRFSPQERRVSLSFIKPNSNLAQAFTSPELQQP